MFFDILISYISVSNNWQIWRLYLHWVVICLEKYPIYPLATTDCL